MSTFAPIRTGIVGYGLSGRIFHSPFLRSDPRFRIDLIATSDPSRQEQARADNTSAEIVRDPDALLARAGDLDLIVLASPAHTHLEQGLAALAAGCAVVIDKPFAATVVEAEQLIGAATRAAVPLIVFQNRRWDGDFLTVEKLVASGALGRIHRFESAFERWSPDLKPRWQDTTDATRGAGITFDLGSHLIDQALRLFGPAEVDHAELSTLRVGGISDDEAFISLRHASGIRSHLTLSRMAGQVGPRFRVLGSEGAFLSSGLDGQESFLVTGGTPDDTDFGVTPAAKWGTLGVDGATKPVPMERGAYPRFYAGVADTILTGAVPPVAPEEALATMRIIGQVHDLA